MTDSKTSNNEGAKLSRENDPGLAMDHPTAFMRGWFYEQQILGNVEGVLEPTESERAEFERLREAGYMPTEGENVLSTVALFQCGMQRTQYGTPADPPTRFWGSPL